MRTQLKTAEAAVSKLKDEAAKTKVLVAQTRSACANEVRKRDRQIDSLKKAVSDAGRARGTTKGSGITTIHVTGEMDWDDQPQSTPRGTTATDGYDLRMETNAFLAELAKNLSGDNELLASLVRETVQRLKEMSGWEGADDARQGAATIDALPLTANPQEMATEIESILDHLRNILTNPSFVPIEEVVVREEEIHRLRDGWVKMEARWKEAVHLIDGWRRRMQTSGRPVNMEELKMGLRLSPVRVRDVAETSQGLLGIRTTSLAAALLPDPEGLSMVQEEPEEPSIVELAPSPAESLHLVPAPEFEEPDEMESDSESSIYEDEVDVDDLDVEEPNVEIIEQSLMMDSPPMPPPPEITPLNDSYSGRNRGRSGPHPYKKRPRDYTATMEENSADNFSERPPASPPHAAAKPQQLPKKQRLQPRLVPSEEASPGSTDLSVSTSSLDSILLAKPADDSTSKPSAPSVKSHHQPSATKKPQGRNSPTAPPAKQPARSATRGRPAPHTTDSQGSAAASRTPVTTESSSTTSSTATVRSKSTDKSMPPPPTPQRSPRRANSRLPLPRNGNPLLPPPQQSPLSMASIAAKLAASEREADAARVRAKLKAARLGKRVSLAPPATHTDTTAGADATRSTRSEGAEQSAVDPVKKDLSTSHSGENNGELNGELSANEDVVGQLRQHKTRKRERRTEKVASRRRSTLNPWELETLIAGSARGAQEA